MAERAEATVLQLPRRGTSRRERDVPEWKLAGFGLFIRIPEGHYPATILDWATRGPFRGWGEKLHVLLAVDATLAGLPDPVRLVRYYNAELLDHPGLRRSCRFGPRHKAYEELTALDPTLAAALQIDAPLAQYVGRAVMVRVVDVQMNAEGDPRAEPAWYSKVAAILPACGFSELRAEVAK